MSGYRDVMCHTSAILDKMDEETEAKKWNKTVAIRQSLQFCANHVTYLSDEELLERLDQIKADIKAKSLIK